MKCCGYPFCIWIHCMLYGRIRLIEQSEMKGERMMDFYCSAIPDFLVPFLNTKPMLRLKNVGMNCGCEYTNFERFRHLPEYSRYQHSLGAALIVWNFTGDRAQALSALFHDISTPAFAHSVDFLHSDYLKQESTELDTEKMIRESGEICSLLKEIGITVAQVADYHQYPIADNDSPRLSSDRLEYSLGNMFRYGFRSYDTAKAYYEDLIVGQGEDGQQELCFRHQEIAEHFAQDALKCSRVYVSDEDRYSMQILAELLGHAISRGILSEEELMRTEPEVIGRLENDPEMFDEWKRFRNLHRMVVDSSAPEERKRIIFAKKRYIDPMVEGIGRVSQISADYRRNLDDFLQTDHGCRICGI